MSNSQPYSQPVDVKQLGVWSAFTSLGAVFWLLGGIELIERLAYFGVKAVRTLYASAPVSAGGLGINLSDFGVILSVWALVQTTVPIIAGGVTDRVGLKKVLAIATLVKVASYVVMAYVPTFWGFFVGAVLLALGTGIFKPAIQGSVVKATSRLNSSVAWGAFYQTINIGAFLGPIVAATLRQTEWRSVFLSCAAIVSLNLVLLLFYREPVVGPPNAVNAEREPLWRAALHELKKPVLLAYLVLFSGFWFMFLALFDVLPVFIHDWVDTRTLVHFLFGPDGASSPLLIFLLGMAHDGQSIKPEGVLNVNAGLIMLFCFVVAGLGARMRAVNSMTLGVMLCASALLMLGTSHAAWLCVAAIVVFSIGEMLSSPKFLEFLGNIAPRDKIAMYLGFSGLPQGIGATLEGYLGPHLYNVWASKETLSRELLASHGLGSADLANVPRGEAFDYLVRISGRSAEALTHQMYVTNDVGALWLVFGAVGATSALGLYVYGRVVLGASGAEATR